MKKILIMVLCSVLLNKATAQADKVILDNVFQYINKTTLPTGYLQYYEAVSLSVNQVTKTVLHISQHPPATMEQYI